MSQLHGDTPIKELYQKLITFRVIESAIADEYESQTMRCPVHLSIGQEAVASAWAHVVRQDDFAVSTHRSHLHFLAKGGSLESLLGELLGREIGCSRGRGGSMHLASKLVNFMGSSAIVGNSIPIGVGLALAAKKKRTDSVSFVFFGDGATEEGVFYESLNFAAIQELPALFIVENNFYSVYSPLSERQPNRESLENLCAALGIQAKTLFGNDLEENFAALASFTELTRQDGKPRLLEFQTYRLVEHCGPNDDDYLGYRPEEEIEYWKQRDPLLLMETKHPELALLKETFASQAREFFNDAWQIAMSSPWPSPVDLDESVYG